MKSEINLKITNNSALELPISILGVIEGQNSLNNINASYNFDMSGETLSSVGFFLGYYNIATPSIVIEAILENVPATLQGYVDALNTLNVGFFTYSGNTIYMFSSNYVGKYIKI